MEHDLECVLQLYIVLVHSHDITVDTNKLIHCTSQQHHTVCTRHHTCNVYAQHNQHDDPVEISLCLGFAFACGSSCWLLMIDHDSNYVFHQADACTRQFSMTTACTLHNVGEHAVRRVLQPVHVVQCVTFATCCTTCSQRGGAATCEGNHYDAVNCQQMPQCLMHSLSNLSLQCN